MLLDFAYSRAKAKTEQIYGFELNNDASFLTLQGPLLLTDYLDGLAQERHSSSVLAMKLHLPCTHPMIWTCIVLTTYLHLQYMKYWYVITLSYSYLKLGHGWVITSHIKQYMWLLVRVLILVNLLVKGAPVLLWDGYFQCILEIIIPVKLGLNFIYPFQGTCMWSHFIRWADLKWIQEKYDRKLQYLLG